MASVKKRPDGKWRARYYDAAGKEHSKHFARKTDGTKWATDQEAAVARGVHVDPRAGRETVRAYGERWRLAQVQHRTETVTKVEVITRLHIYPTLGDRRIASVRRSDVQALVAAWAATAAPRSVSSRYGYLSALFASAVADGVIGQSPCTRIRLPEIADAPVVPLTIVQVAAIHEAIVERYRPTVLVGAGCGLRISEVLGLTRESVRFLARDLDVRWQLSARRPWALVPPKSKNSTRAVPAPQFVVDALSQLAPGKMLGTLVHRGDDAKGEPVSAVMLQEAFAAAVKTINLRAGRREDERKAGRTALPELPTVPADTTFHDLRHHYASLLIEGGESVTVVAARLGDTPAQVLKTYAHLWPDTADRTRRIVDAAWTSADFQDHADGLRTVESGQVP